MPLRAALNVLLPRRCPGCQGQLGSSAGLCAGCVGSLQPQVQRHSPLCTAVTPHLVVLGPYRGVLGRSVRALKYGGSRELGGVLGSALARGLPADWGIQAVVGVPLFPERLRERGFNQAERLGRPVAAALGVPYCHGLDRRRATGAQAKRHVHDRLNALQDAFVARPGLPDTVLLIDDVVTTGSTLLACAGALRDGGVRQIYFAAVAR